MQGPVRTDEVNTLWLAIEARFKAIFRVSLLVALKHMSIGFTLLSPDIGIEGWSASYASLLYNMGPIQLVVGLQTGAGIDRGDVDSSGRKGVEKVLLSKQPSGTNCGIDRHRTVPGPYHS